MKKKIPVGILIIIAFLLSNHVFLKVMQSHNGEFRKEKVYAAETVDAGLPKEYIEAYDLFLKACATDAGEYTYDKPVKKLKEIIETAENQEIKMRCCFLVSFSCFLQGNFDEAYLTGIAGLRLAGTCLQGNSRIALLNKIKKTIEDKEITDISEVITILDLGEEGSGLVSDLVSLYRSYKESWKMAEECWQKYRVGLDERMNALVQEGVSTKQLDTMKRELEEKYRKRGYIHPSILETYLARYRESSTEKALERLVE